MYLFKSVWNDYFSGTTSPTLDSNQYNSRQTPSSSSVYVFNCLFNSFTSGSDGGALYCSTSVTYLLVESTSFFSCKTSGQGGAIYFYNTNDGQCVLYGVCGNDCCTTSSTDGQFAHIVVNNGASIKDYVNYSSIVRCVNENSGSRFTFYHCNGINYCQSVNISMNKCGYYSGIIYHPFVDSSSVTCSVSYSSFVNNHVIGYACIAFNRGGPKHEIKYCNIIRNSQSSTSDGLIRICGNTWIDDSCILENTATTIFWVYSSYKITLSNCTVDSTSKYGSVVTQSTVTKSFIHGLNHMSTRNCNSEYDSAGTLSAIPYVSRTTKKEFCYTSKLCHCQARISDFFSLNWVFIVTFIHSNPSGYC
jgi:hypothetical protein